MTAEPVLSIELNGIEKSYGSTRVLHGIDLAIEEGEFITFLGPSGSGKTTTLNLIAGFEDPTAGTISVRGTDVTRMPPHKRDLGVVFQHYALFPHLSVFKNVAFPLQQRGADKASIRATVAAALEMVGLDSQASKRPNQLSGGQQQRVALARALVFDPQAMLLDEPLSALDKKLREGLQLELRRIHKEVGRTFVFVTHDQEEALALSDRIAVFNNGRIEQLGTSADLYYRPRTLFVASFIGDSVLIQDHSRQETVVVRPEAVEIRRRDDVPLGAPSVSATLLESTFLGSSWRHEFQLADGTRAHARTQHHIEHHVNDRVSYTWSERDASRFPMDSGVHA